MAIPGDVDVANVVRGQAAAKAADALLRALGGTTVYLRRAVAAPANATAGQLGIEGAATEDVRLAPVVIKRKAKGGAELLMSATVVARAAQTDPEDADGAQAWLQAALCVIVHGRLWRIESVAVETFGGVPYLYRVLARLES